MRLNVLARMTCFGVVVSTAIACAKRPVTEVPSPAATPAQTPAAPAPSPVPAPGKTVLRQSTTQPEAIPWAFTYTPATLTYDIETEGTVALLPDSAHPRTVPTRHQRVTLTLGVDGSVQLVDPAQSLTPVCDSVAILATRALQLIPKIPVQLSTGLTWSDSTTTDMCVGTTLANTTMAYTYTVVGDTTFNGVNALHIVRSSTATAKGEGNEGQHRIVLFTSGAGNTDLYFDVSAGRFLGSTGMQTAFVDVTTSGRMNHFLQRATERVTLIRTP